MIDAAIRVPTRIENIQMAIPATDVHALAFCVDEDIVGIAAQLDIGNCSPVSDGIRGESRGISECDDDMPGFGIQRHWEVAAVASRPPLYFLSRGAVDNDDRLVGRIVHENPIIDLIELEALRMRFEIDLGDFASNGWIDDYQSAMACHKQLVRDRIYTDVVRVLACRDSRDRSVIIPAEDRHRSVATISDIQSVGRGVIAQSLRLAQT